MALITISGEPGCRTEEVARITAQGLGFEFLSPSRLANLIREEFNSATVPDKAYAYVKASTIARLATQAHLLVVINGGAPVLRKFPGSLLVHLTAPEAKRIGAMMVDRRVDRATARELLRELEKQEKSERKTRFGRVTYRPEDHDLVINAATLETEQIAALIGSAAEGLHLRDQGFLASSAEAQLQFQFRLQLSRHGIVPASHVQLKKTSFGHPSEEIFANLLDFYRIAWEYEPKSFPIQWDKDGRVLEAFTPDFYLPEFDMYVELTTMKQAHVTKKNRKVKLLRTIYPHINIQVFYQKDFQNLIFKYGLAERPMHV
jgi:cytidylate kinase